MTKNDVEDLPMSGPRGSDREQEKASNSTLGAEIAGMSVAELLRLRARIDGALPPLNLEDISASNELVMQLQVVKQLQADVMGDDSIPANQRAQVAGQVSSVLISLIKLQAETYNLERLKKMEQIFVECAVGLPADTYTAFLTEYERRLKG